MKLLRSAPLLLFPILLSACGGEDFSGLYASKMGGTVYHFQENGDLRVTMGDETILSQFSYDEDKNELTVKYTDNTPTMIYTIEEGGKIDTDNGNLYPVPTAKDFAAATWLYASEEGDYTELTTFEAHSDTSLTATRQFLFLRRDNHYITDTYQIEVTLQGRDMIFIDGRNGDELRYQLTGKKDETLAWLNKHGTRLEMSPVSADYTLTPPAGMTPLE